MRIGKWSVLFLAATLLSGCKGFWDVPSGSGGTGTGTASGVFFVLNQKTSQIAGYSFATGSTTLTAATNSPYSLGTSVPLTMAISPDGGFLYVSTAAGIYVYSVLTDGTLTLLNGGQVISSDAAFTMAVDPSGGWLVEAISGVAAVNAIPLDATTGLVLTGGSEQSIGLANATAIQQVTVTRSAAANPYVFVAMGTTGIAVVPFTYTNTDPFGAPTGIKPINTTTGGDITVAVDVSRPLLYVGETVAVSGSNPGGLRVFTIGANSALTEVTGSPYGTGGIGPSAILPTTNYVYVANKSVSSSSTGNITGFAITTTGTVYSLTSVSTIAAGVSTIGLAEDSTGTYVLAINASGGPDLNAFTFDATTAGKLDTYTTAATGTDPVQAVAIAAAP